MGDLKRKRECNESDHTIASMAGPLKKRKCEGIGDGLGCMAGGSLDLSHNDPQAEELKYPSAAMCVSVADKLTYNTSKWAYFTAKQCSKQ